MLEFIGGLVVIIGSIILDGYVLSILWEWFIVPVFSLPILPIVAAIGVSLLVAYLTHQYSISDIKNYDFTIGMIIAILKPIIALCFGWVVHSFM